MEKKWDTVIPADLKRLFVNGTCIREKTGAENIVKEIKEYQEKWLQHVQRMDTKRIPKQALQYKPRKDEDT
jgi:hypothetical protein